MGFVKGMPRLEEVEFRGGLGGLFSWDSQNHWRGEDAFVGAIVDAFVDERRNDREWVCPRVRVIDVRTGVEKAVLERGKWVDEEEGEGAVV